MAVEAPVKSEVGFAPDSVWAEYTAEEREISERMEAEYNDRRAGVLAVRDANEHHSVRGCTDDGLRRLLKERRRELEDIEDGDLSDSSTGYRSRMVKAKIADIEGEQGWRSILAECWRAAENGTHSYTAFMARGGLLAVIDHGATPPSYELAGLLDWEHFERGKVHVLDWQSRDGGES